MATEGGGYRGGHLLAAFLVGAAAGALAAYLIGPEVADRARDRVKRAAGSAKRAAREAPRRFRGSLSRAVEAARSVLEDALDES